MKETNNSEKVVAAFLYAPLVPVLFLLAYLILGKFHEYGLPSLSFLFLYKFLKSFIILFFIGATISYVIAAFLFLPQYFLFCRQNRGYVFYGLMGGVSGIMAYYIISIKILHHSAEKILFFDLVSIMMTSSGLLAALVFRYILGNTKQ